jgi:SAM-dependent methyltransferase
MYCDIADLREFYDSRLGRAAKYILRRQLLELWPNLQGQRILGLGYAAPLLRPYFSQAERIVAAMPAQQGILYWPREGPNKATLVHETNLPFRDCFFDYVLMMHTLESTENVRGLLREVWRVLAGNGRVLMIVPNRLGLWARRENSPFAYGQPYSMGQLKQLLHGSLFTPSRFIRALYLPPSDRLSSLKIASFWEQTGKYTHHALSGVIMIEAYKQQYAPLNNGTPAPVTRWRPQNIGGHLADAAP